MVSPDDLKAEEVSSLEQMLTSLPRVSPRGELREKILTEAREYIEREERRRQMFWMSFAAACMFLACLLFTWTQGMRLKVLVPAPAPRDLVEMQIWQQQLRLLQANGRMNALFTDTALDEEIARPSYPH
ncbi:MAG: hypothetical protein KatS3mg112_0203 [Thermogutta sp.]|nr:MAG: hypothetical protein KatS3mg112_0203 [Thermogutta sp.]